VNIEANPPVSVPMQLQTAIVRWQHVWEPLLMDVRLDGYPYEYTAAIQRAKSRYYNWP
jgi:hypothetical protein